MPAGLTAKLGTTLYFDIATNNVSGLPAAADANPTCWIYQNGNQSPVIGPSGLSPFVLGNTYQGQLPLTNANGFFSQNYYNVIVSGMVNGVPGVSPILTFFVENQSFDNVQPSGSPVTVNVIQSGAISTIWGQIFTELQNVPPASSCTYGQAIQWLYERARNYSVTNSGEDLIYMANGLTPLASSILVDDGTNFFRNPYR